MKYIRQRQRGLGLVELMVGITVGLIVAAGASLVAVNQINEHRRLILETQVQQDLRTAADLLQQEMRRAGFRGQADLGVWAPAKAVGSLTEQSPGTAGVNQYAPLTVTVDSTTGTVVSYLYARQDPVTLKYSPTGTPSSNEQFGFKWDKTTEVLYMQLGVGADGQPNWQPITDPDNLRIKDFRVNVTSTAINLGGFCDQPCDLPGTPNCPSQAVREVNFKIVGQAKHDVNVVRTLSGTERMRAETITGACP
ncbi:PilW family protein [Roseateles saccharophilus]|nr:prepilin-type N-terminal cleavage/methylation domain-containing protein [Roseateles saccharophilus]